MGRRTEASRHAGGRAPGSSHTAGAEQLQSPSPRESRSCPKEPRASTAAAGAPQSPPVLARRRARPSPSSPPHAASLEPGSCTRSHFWPPGRPAGTARCPSRCPSPASAVSAQGTVPQRPVSQDEACLLSLQAPLCPPAHTPQLSPTQRLPACPQHSAARPPWDRAIPRSTNKQEACNHLGTHSWLQLRCLTWPHSYTHVCNQPGRHPAPCSWPPQPDACTSPRWPACRVV